jgi:hypothetical protein
MKTIIFTLCSLAGLCSTAFSQYLYKEAVLQKYYDYHIENTAVLPNNNIFLTGYGKQSYDLGSVHVNYSFNWNGDLIPSTIKNIAQNIHYVKKPLTGLTDIITTGIDTVFCTDCATGLNGYWGVIKEDINGNNFETLSQFSYEVSQQLSDLFYSNFFNFPPCRGFVYTSTGNLITTSDNIFNKIPSNGNLFNLFEIDTVSIISKAILPYGVDTFLVLDSANAYVMDTIGNLFPFSSLPFVIDEVKQRDDSTYLVKRNRTYYLMNNQIQFTDSISFDQDSDTILSVHYANNLFAALTSLNNIFKVRIGNSNTPITEWLIDTEGFYPQFLEVNCTIDSFFVAGFETGHLNQHLMVQFYSSIPNNFQKSQTDIILGNMLSFERELNYCETEYGNSTGVKFTPFFEVINNSPDTITEYFINGFKTGSNLPSWCGWNFCFDNKFYIKVNASISPYSRDTFAFPILRGNLASPLMDFCFWLTAPNQQADRNPADNMQCIYNYNVGIQEIDSTPNFNIFPNPSNGLLNLELNSGGALQIKVYNLLGAPILNIKTSDLTSQLDLSNLAKGVYIVEFIDNRGIKKSRKVILQ